VDLPAGASEASAAAINMPGFGELPADMDFSFFNGEISIDALPVADHWMAAASSTLAR